MSSCKGFGNCGRSHGGHLGGQNEERIGSESPVAKGRADRQINEGPAFPPPSLLLSRSLRSSVRPSSPSLPRFPLRPASCPSVRPSSTLRPSPLRPPPSARPHSFPAPSPCVRPSFPPPPTIWRSTAEASTDPVWNAPIFQELIAVLFRADTGKLPFRRARRESGAVRRPARGFVRGSATSDWKEDRVGPGAQRPDQRNSGQTLQGEYEPCPCPSGHRGKTLSCRAVTSILSQLFLQKMTNSSAFSIAHIHACQTSRLSQYLASIRTDKLVQYICRNINCAQGKRCLHSRWNFISMFTEFTRPWRRTLTSRLLEVLMVAQHTAVKWTILNRTWLLLRGSYLV